MPDTPSLRDALEREEACDPDGYAMVRHGWLADVLRAALAAPRVDLKVVDGLLIARCPKCRACSWKHRGEDGLRCCECNEPYPDQTIAVAALAATPLGGGEVHNRKDKP
jgi:hypothetical protein